MRRKKLVSVFMTAVLACGLLIIPAGQGSASGKVKLNKTKVTLTVGKTVKLKLKNAPKGKKITWKSSKKSVAAVSSKGIVKAKKKGTAKIIAKAAGKRYTCKVTVKAKASSSTPDTPTTQAPKQPTTQAPKQPATQAPTTQATTTQAPTTQAPATQNPAQASTQDEKSTPARQVKLTNTEGKDEKEVAVLKRLIGKLVADGAAVSTDLDSDEYKWIDGKIDSVFWSDKNIKGELSFEGLDALNSISCEYNQISKLDVSKNSELISLKCSGNQLTELDVSKNDKLEYLSCEENQLKTLDVSNNPDLKSLYCWSNQLTELDLSNNRKMESILYDDKNVMVTGYEATPREEPVTEGKGSDASTEETPTEEKTENPGKTEQGTTEEGNTAGGKESEEDVTSEQSIIVRQVTASPGDENVRVDIIVKNNPGILGMLLTVGYDDTVLHLTDAQVGEALSVLTFEKGGVLKNGCSFSWDGEIIKSGQIQDGTILTLTFDIPKDASKGVYPISFTYRDGDIYNNDLDNLSFKIMNGSITVE